MTSIAWMSPAGARTATSFYDNAPLRETLLELVDFSIINDRKARFSVGAVNVLTGNFVYFDNRDEEIVPEHVMASGALPPALPMVKIGTDYFWDGGIVSNTPLQHLLEQEDGLEFAGVPGRSVQRARPAAARDGRRARPPQGHHVFLAHALQHRHVPQAAKVEAAHARGACPHPGGQAQRRRKALDGRAATICRR